MPPKAKRSKELPSRGISNFMPHASSQGHSTSVEPPLQLSELAQPRVRRDTSKMMSLASFQGHSALVEPSLQPSTAAQPCAPTITIMPFSVPTAQNMVSTSVPPSHTMPCKDKRSNRRVCRGISNLMPHASSQGHSTRVEPPLKPSTEAQPRALVITFIPPSIPTAQNLVSASDPLLRKRPRKTKFSRERASLGISNLIPYASSHGNSTPVEPRLQPSRDRINFEFFGLTWLHGSYFERRPILKSKAAVVKWVKEWVPQDLVTTGGKCMILKWVTEDTLKTLKEKVKEP
ncbi:hypothetical protein JHK84_055286 [Glycine max]|nr:hypothetical protein JHK84_055286 [Glycine max]